MREPLTETEIQENKQEFIKILKDVERKDANIDELLTLLEDSDFYYAPASTKYHGAYKGGLCDHCLNVYYNLMHLVKYTDGYIHDLAPSTESIAIVALLHDLDKINKYKIGVRNEKVYCENGSKHDELGNFDWVSRYVYQTVPDEERMVYGNHEMNSEYLIRQFIPLTKEESVAILHHMGSMNFDSAKDNIGSVYNKYPLAVLLYMADMMSTYINEAH